MQPNECYRESGFEAAVNSERDSFATNDRLHVLASKCHELIDCYGQLRQEHDQWRQLTKRLAAALNKEKQATATLKLQMEQQERKPTDEEQALVAALSQMKTDKLQLEAANAQQRCELVEASDRIQGLSILVETLHASECSLEETNRALHDQLEEEQHETAALKLQMEDQQQRSAKEVQSLLSAFDHVDTQRRRLDQVNQQLQRQLSGAQDRNEELNIEMEGLRVQESDWKKEKKALQLELEEKTFLLQASHQHSQPRMTRLKDEMERWMARATTAEAEVLIMRNGGETKVEQINRERPTSGPGDSTCFSANPSQQSMAEADQRVQLSDVELPPSTPLDGPSLKPILRRLSSCANRSKRHVAWHPIVGGFPPREAEADGSTSSEAPMVPQQTTTIQETKKRGPFGSRSLSQAEKEVVVQQRPDLKIKRDSKQRYWVQFKPRCWNRKAGQPMQSPMQSPEHRSKVDGPANLLDSTKAPATPPSLEVGAMAGPSTGSSEMFPRTADGTKTPPCFEVSDATGGLGNVDHDAFVTTPVRDPDRTGTDEKAGVKSPSPPLKRGPGRIHQMRAKFIEPAKKKDMEKDKHKSGSKASRKNQSDLKPIDLRRGSVTVVAPDPVPCPPMPHVPEPRTDIVQCVSKHAFATGDVLGEGTFGIVLRGMFNGQQVAIKMLVNQDSNPSIVEEFDHEVSIMTQLRHPHVCRLLAVCRDVGHIAMLLPMMEQGSLWDILGDPAALTPQLRMRFVFHIALGMEYLHSFRPRIIHRDLKSENVLVDADFSLKIADFGLSCRMKRGGVKGICGTPGWMAPEVFRGESYSEKADVYSFAIVVWEICTGKAPHPDLNVKQLAKAVGHGNLRPIIPARCPSDLKALMAQCWASDPSCRPSFTKIVQECRSIMGPKPRWN